jgi:hypothetical protein
MGMLRVEIEEILKQHKIWINSNCWEGKQACFRNAVLRYESFTKKELVCADFSYADLRGIYMISTNLYGSSFEAALAKDGNFFAANLQYTNFEHSDLEGANFENADLSYSNLSSAFLKNTNFENARLKGCNFYGASINDCIFPDRPLKVGKLYKVINRFVPYHNCLVCLISINDDKTLDLLDGKSGMLYRSQYNMIKFSLEEV